MKIEPLHEVVYKAFWACPRENFRLSSAYMLRAIAEEMPLHFDPWLQEHSDVQSWLLSEANRAETGE